MIPTQIYQIQRELIKEQQGRLEVLCEGTDGSTTAIMTIVRLREELAEREWVSVEDRLPEDHVLVVVSWHEQDEDRVG